MQFAVGGRIMGGYKSCRIPRPGRPGERPFAAMQRLFDKWFLPVLFVLIGGVLVWTVWKGWS